MGYYTMAFMGTAPIGSLLAGACAHRIGASYTMMLAGAICIVDAILFALALPRLREEIRPVYIRAGILPPISMAVQSATELRRPPEQTG
jgi:hypothetical protein